MQEVSPFRHAADPLAGRSRLIRDLQLVDASGRNYLIADERQRFLEAARLAPRPADQTFALTLALTGTRVSEALAVRPMDIDLEAASIRIRTLKRRAEHWRKVPLPPSCSAPSSSSTHSAQRRRKPPASPSGLGRGRPPTGRSPGPWPTPASRVPKRARRACGMVLASRPSQWPAIMPLPTIAAALGHANLQTTTRSTPPPRVSRRGNLSGSDVGSEGEQLLLDSAGSGA